MQRRAAEFSTGRVEQRGLSGETPQLPEDTLNPAVKAEPARAPSATKAMAESRGVIPRAEARAWVAGRGVVAEHRAAVVAVMVVGAANPSFLYALGNPEIQK